MSFFNDACFLGSCRLCHVFTIQISPILELGSSQGAGLEYVMCKTGFYNAGKPKFQSSTSTSWLNVVKLS